MAGLADALAALLDARGSSRSCSSAARWAGWWRSISRCAIRKPRRGACCWWRPGRSRPIRGLALAKADALAAAPWNEETVAPMVDGFFLPAPVRLQARGVSEDRAGGLAGGRGRGRALEREPADVRATRRRSRVPTMIIQGRHDRARTPEHGADDARAHPRLRARGDRGRWAHAAARAARSAFTRSRCRSCSRRRSRLPPRQREHDHIGTERSDHERPGPVSTRRQAAVHHRRQPRPGAGDGARDRRRRRRRGAGRPRRREPREDRRPTFARSAGRPGRSRPTWASPRTARRPARRRWPSTGRSTS